MNWLWFVQQHADEMSGCKQDTITKSTKLIIVIIYNALWRISLINFSDKNTY